MNALINVGMNIGRTNERMPAALVQDTIERCNLDLVDWNIIHGEAEDTFVARVNRMTETKAYRLACCLQQECIAVYDMDKCKGSLHGPEVSKWGAFNAEFFRVL